LLAKQFRSAFIKHYEQTYLTAGVGEGGEFEERQQRMIEGIIKQTVNL
jgi:hypothetical protein